MTTETRKGEKTPDQKNLMAAQNAVRCALRKYAKELESLALSVFRNPELGFEEKQACALQVRLLQSCGFHVISPFAGLATAYKAVWGKGRPAFCFLAEYDALPEIGHACGHNLICGAAIGAGCALRDVLAQRHIPGTIVVIGTPAEESRGGKVIMVRRGAFRGIDAVMEAHPSWRTVPDTGSTAIRRVSVSYVGRATHAAASPELGKNALDAVMLLFQGVNAWRQHLLETSRIHGIVTEGGVAPNIVPSRASAVFFLRALDDAELAAMIKRFRDIARGAALMTGTRLKFTVHGDGYMGRIPNAPLNAAYLEAAAAAGLNPQIPDRSGRASSDFGDVSHVVPGVHVYFGIGRNVLPSHSPEFREAAGSAYGRRQMLRAAEALAVVGYRYFTNAEFRKRVRADFRAKTRKSRRE
ncbi:MAG: M20 family metallopeptidase [Kiritimatiellae bacterium]|nr:M20 family metallopeptidase [Kiritimatiellia bacterium]